MNPRLSDDKTLMSKLFLIGITFPQGSSLFLEEGSDSVVPPGRLPLRRLPP